VVRAVLVADHGDRRDLAVGQHPAPIVGLGQLGVEAFQHHLAHRRRLAEPDRRRHHEDVRVEQLAAPNCSELDGARGG